MRQQIHALQTRRSPSPWERSPLGACWWTCLRQTSITSRSRKPNPSETDRQTTNKLSTAQENIHATREIHRKNKKFEDHIGSAFGEAIHRMLGISLRTITRCWKLRHFQVLPQVDFDFLECHLNTPHLRKRGAISRKLKVQ